MKKNSAFLLYLFTVSIMVFITLFFVQAHEQTHQQIFAYFGCHSTIQWFYDGAAAATIPDANCHVPIQAIQLNSINEIMGYNISVILLALMVIIFFLFLILMELSRGNRKGEQINTTLNNNLVQDTLNQEGKKLEGFRDG